ncbi:EAL domain-containing protein [Curvibacter sp. HBC61]|uniref:EAL domain-containing protein n=1 Tax=Curvibacter cyanobacteriorum TaxID=3026422 RepID=A0ABT5N317_9BURK|nr:EAL domain-containing protein [Curvibacter sp. HBC61]MDD0839452.1 EAL domain-containing protein [Curvibacter sp. HBC61]
MAIALLLIECDSAHQEALRELLTRQYPGWHLALATSVAQARSMLQLKAPDVAVVASQLPDGSAFDLLDALGELPAVIMVDPGEEAAAARGLREGFADYLIKDPRHGYLHTLPGQVLAAVDKMRLERALQESAALSELALEGAGLGFWQRNLLTGEASLSQRWLELLDLPAVPTARDWQHAVHPQDWSRVQSLLQHYLSGDRPVYEAEYRLRHRDGHWLWVASRGRVVEWTLDGQPRLLCGTYMDVSARRHADEALARQHRLLQALSQAQSTFIANLEPHAAFDGLLQFLIDFTGADAGCLGEAVRSVDDTALCLIHASTEPLDEAMQQQLQQAVQTGQVQRRDEAGDGELPAECRQAIPITHAGRVVACLGLSLPTTARALDLAELEPLLNTASQLVMAWRARLERRQAQDQLREATEQLAQKTQALELTLDSISQGISSVDAEGVIQIYNRRYLEVLDLPESLLARRPKAHEVVRFQTDRGDFGHDFEYIVPEARAYVAGEYAQSGPQMPEIYLRRTPTGRVIEVHTLHQPGGGRVRTFSDVTRYFEAQEALRQSEERWRNLSQLSSDWYWEQDENFRFVRLDGHNFERTGLADEQSTLGRTRWEIDAPNVTEAQWAEHRRALEAHEPFHDFEMQRTTTTDGRVRWVSISGAPMFDAEGRFTGYRGVGRDITEKKKAEAIIERLAFYDELTSLPNRRLLLVRLTATIQACARGPHQGALLFLDLDNFKDLNDTLGHDRGDQLLTQVATRLVACVRPDDTVARLGGDEFVVILGQLGASHAEAATSAETVAQKILSALNQPYPIGDSLHHSTPSIGIALFSSAQTSAEELLKRGDLAMYQAKAAGRNTLCFFDPGMQEAVSARSAMEADMRQALQHGQFRLLYQPVVNGQGRMLGVEALVRWNHPQRGNISPAEFIPLAEKTGLILPLGRWVLQTACRQLVSWASDPLMAHLTVAVNVSAREFRDPGFVEAVLAVLEATGARPTQLKLELTESLLLNDVEDIIAKMTRLQMRGVGFSLDDFGTGYSSLSYLKRLPLDQLKIDQSFVRDVLTDPNDATIARTIIALASSLGLSVVAEGVETVGQRAFLLRNGCEAFQGYLFSRPVAAVALPGLVASPLG